MARKKLTEERPYIVLETDASDIESLDEDDSLSDSEWSVVTAFFKNHPKLITIKCPYRDPELIEELGKVRTGNK